MDIQAVEFTLKTPRRPFDSASKTQEEGISKIVYVETPANPTNTLIDLRMCRALADYLPGSGQLEVVICYVDNTYIALCGNIRWIMGPTCSSTQLLKHWRAYDVIVEKLSLQQRHDQTIEKRTFLGNMWSMDRLRLLLRSLNPWWCAWKDKLHNAQR